MNIYKQLEDALYTSFSTHFPDDRFIFPFLNAPEPQTPYVVLDIQKIDAIGMPQDGGLTDNGTATIVQNYEVKVIVEILGEYDNQTVVGDLAHKIEFSIRTPLFQQVLATNNLSLMRYKPVDRFPRKRDTKTYMCYQQSLFFAYSVSETQDVGYINEATIQGVYHDAGREGHIIENDIVIQNPNL